MTTTNQTRSTTHTVEEIPLPEDVRTLTTLPRIDYADAFAVTADVERSAAEWVRAVIQDAPLRIRRDLWLGWVALGLKIGLPWSSDRVVGWKVKYSDPAVVLLAADSWLGFRGELLFRSEPEGLLFATLIQQDNAAARALWGALAPHHVRVVRSLLRHAA